MPPKPKLTDDEVAEIRRLKAADATLSNTELGRRFGVDRSYVSRILSGATRDEMSPLKMIPWARITPNIRNVRSVLSEDENTGIGELAESIRARGVLQPLRVEPPDKHGGDYVLVDGHRRWRALRRLVHKRIIESGYAVPAIVAPRATPQDLTLDQMAANLARADMHPLDEAEAFHRLVDGGKGTQEIAAAVGRTQRHIQSRLRLSRRLGVPAKGALWDGQITLAQAEALCDGDEGQQAHILHRIDQFPTEADIRAWLCPAPKKVTTENTENTEESQRSGRDDCARSEQSPSSESSADSLRPLCEPPSEANGVRLEERPARAPDNEVLWRGEGDWPEEIVVRSTTTWRRHRYLRVEEGEIQEDV